MKQDLSEGVQAQNILDVNHRSRLRKLSSFHSNSHTKLMDWHENNYDTYKKIVYWSI